MLSERDLFGELVALVHEVYLFGLGAFFLGSVFFFCGDLVFRCKGRGCLDDRVRDLVGIEDLLLNKLRLPVSRGAATLVQRDIEVVLELTAPISVFIIFIIILIFLHKELQDIVLCLGIEIVIVVYYLVN